MKTFFQLLRVLFLFSSFARYLFNVTIDIQYFLNNFHGEGLGASVTNFSHFPSPNFFKKEINRVLKKIKYDDIIVICIEFYIFLPPIPHIQKDMSTIVNYCQILIRIIFSSN